VIVALSLAINLSNYAPKVPTPENSTASSVNGHESALSVAAPATRRGRTLTFADRVAYQRAIEEVYWRHRMWPAANAGPKPPLDKVMRQAEIEKKVEDYLRNSQALEDYSQRLLTAEQLQAEMDRMAQHTKQPEVLRELFEALGNDAFVIAECLARPLLTDRSVGDLSARDKTRRFESAQPQGLRSVSIATTFANVAYTLPKISEGDPPCTDDTWASTSITSAPDGRQFHTAVWTGSEMIVWGGFASGGYSNAGGRYNPSTDSWTATSITSAPAGRYYHTAVWTGNEMIVWGGNDGTNLLNTGGRYNPSTDAWTATSTTNAPAGRQYHTAVWTGNEMIVWGGGTLFPNVFNTGGRYNPSTDSWTATSTTNAPDARSLHTAVWIGSEMIIWGGLFYDGNNHFFNTGGRYNPGTDSWTATSTASAPAGRHSHTAVWTGSEMIVWGGFGNCQCCAFCNSGGQYDPRADSWTATSTVNAPSGRYYHTAVWTGSEMIVWGGEVAGGWVNTGGRYDLGTDSWTATSTTNAPTARERHTAVWASSEMIVWGGYDLANFLNTGGRYCAQPSLIHPAFFSGEVSLGNGVYYLQFPNGTPFGYYAYLTDPRFIYHFDMGYEYWFDANDGRNGIFFYDFMSNHFFYTSPSFPFPFLYDFSLNTVLYYFPDPNHPGHYTTNPRYFYNFATHQVITM
jgi:N-acetylneuraminic acid mutarotase